ncbi:MAG: dihydrolipoyl dehydrogenase [Candidatus Micrarchaeota archaeon]|nr:dihydrolipoyl dehydrogenase [Candidatus Micrarchaeota archaeon]MDE1833966.1 dihydrolipoyl dehydrogenase [Candidatus Micrarchaeota archaeon]MDE1859833.1 dihydrolipoyl dehydrogenase [Candidatus Micrarchaeota archaeon]
MVMGSLPENVDVAVLGGGVGGYVAAIRASELGKNVAIVEKNKMGGHCLNYACIPSKTMIYIADLFYDMTHSEKFGIKASEVKIDPQKMYQWRMDVSKKLESGVEYLCKSNGIEVIKTKGTFISSNQIQMENGEELDFKKAIIATGSEPKEVAGFGADKGVIDYKAALMLQTIPQSMSIIGAGYVAVEIGTLFAKLGSKVDIIAHSDVLSKFDREAVDLVKKRMQQLGVTIHTNATPSSLQGSTITLSNGETINSQTIVSAVGLVPYTDGLGLQNTKVKTDAKGFILVNSSMQTQDPNIYAVGDAVGEPLLAHKAIRQGEVAGEAAAGQNASYDNKVVPAVIFSDPEVAIAGILEGQGIKTKKFPLTALGRAIALDNTNGFIKIAYDDSENIKGVEIVSPDANAMIAEAALAIEMGATLEDVADTIHPHPTFSELFQEVAGAALDRPIHFYYGSKK